MGRHKITCRSRDVQALNARAMVPAGWGWNPWQLSWGGCFLRRGFVFFFCWGGIDPIKCCLKGISNGNFQKALKRKFNFSFINTTANTYNTHIDLTNILYTV